MPLILISGAHVVRVNPFYLSADRYLLDFVNSVCLIFIKKSWVEIYKSLTTNADTNTCERPFVPHKKTARAVRLPSFRIESNTYLLKQFPLPVPLGLGKLYGIAHKCQVDFFACLPTIYLNPAGRLAICAWSVYQRQKSQKGQIFIRGRRLLYAKKMTKSSDMFLRRSCLQSHRTATKNLEFSKEIWYSTWIKPWLGNWACLNEKCRLPYDL